MKSSISESVTHHLQAYFDDLQGEDPANMYEMVLGVVEKPMLEVVMLRAAGNQSKLGVNRNTLRKKLLKYGMVD